jgi:hypothetical protein
VVLLLAVAVVVLCTYARLRVWHALVCVLFGFYLAGSALAPSISTATTALLNALSGR